jgi:hypothetical protein
LLLRGRLGGVYPDEVVGMVLVDRIHEEVWQAHPIFALLGAG